MKRCVLQIAMIGLTIVTIAVLLGGGSLAHADQPLPQHVPGAPPGPTPTADIVPDSQVDSLIDGRFSPQEHAIIRQAFLSVPPDRRAGGLMFRSIDGKFHASSCDLLAFEIHQQLLRAGLTVATPEGTFTEPLVQSSDYPGAKSCGIAIPARGGIEEVTPTPLSTSPSAHLS